MLPYLNEKQSRLLVATEAILLGRGGISLVSIATGVSRPTITIGCKELSNFPDIDVSNGEQKRVRQPGGGRKKTILRDPELLMDLEGLIDPVTRGDPESALRWTCKSVRKLSDELNQMGHKTSHHLVSELLHAAGYSLQANRKTHEGDSHVDRNEQFEYIHRKIQEFQVSNQPVISVDTKKKELIGNYRNNGKELRPMGEPEEVNVYDFIDKKLGKVAPYGIYDIQQNSGWVNVGTDHDTASFAVESIRRWWHDMGHDLYSEAKRLFITADGGGSNGYRVRLWKVELQKLANEIGLDISVSHLPAGTSKWNKIEHRLFSFISKNWRGKPLISHEVVVNLIAATTTKKGLTVKCQLDTNTYPKGIKVTDEELQQVSIERDSFHGEWNYIIRSNV